MITDKILVNKVSKKEQLGLMVLTIFLFVLFFVRDVREYDIGKMILILPILLYTFTTKTENLYPLLALLMPLSFGLSTGFIFPFIILLLIMRKMGAWQKSVVFAGFFVVYEVIHYSFYSAGIPRFEPATVLALGYNIFFVAYFLNCDKLWFDKDRFLLFFCIGTSIFIICVLGHSIHNFGLMGVFSGYYRLGSEGIGEEVEYTGLVYFRANANTMAYYSVTCISLLVILLKRKTINFVLAIILFVIFVFGGLTTLSRTWALSLFLLAFLYILTLKRHRIRGIALLLLFSIMVLFILMQFDAIYSAFADRFNNDTLETGGSRTIIFEAYNDYLMSNHDALLFGVGVMHHNLVCMVDSTAHSTHNSLQQLVVSYGLIGAVIFLFSFFWCIFKLYHKGRENSMYLLPLVLVLFFLQTIQLFYPVALMLPLIPAAVVVSMATKKLK